MNNQGIVKDITLNLDINARKRIEGLIDIRLYSKDVETGQFNFVLRDEDNKIVILDENYEGNVLIKFNNKETTIIRDMEVTDNSFKFTFPHNLITQDDTCTIYVYVTKNGKTSDVAAITFDVFVSEIDRKIGEIEEIEVVGKDKLVQEIFQLINDDIDTVVNTDIVIDTIEKSGKLNGKSAYELAVDNGYIGTEAEWIKSLDKESHDIVLEVEERQDQVEQFNNQVITEMTNKDVISAPEIIDARGGEVTLGDRLNKTTTQLEQMATVPNASPSDLDATPIIQSVLDSENRIQLPFGRLKLKDRLLLDGKKDINIQGQGIDKTFLDFENLAFRVTNPFKITRTINSNFNYGENTATLNTEGMAVGDLIEFGSAENMEETEQTVRKNHLARINRIDGNIITLSHPFPTNFKSNFVTTYNVFQSGKLKISDMTITCDYSNGITGLYLIDLVNLNMPEIRNVKIINRSGGYQGLTSDWGRISAIRNTRSFGAVFDNCHFDSINYGIMPTYGAVDTTITSCTAVNSRHLQAPTGGAQLTKVSNCTTTNCYAGFDSHQTAYDSYFDNCHSYGDEVASKLRGRYDVATNCTFSNGLEVRNDPGIANVDYGQIDKIIERTLVLSNAILAVSRNVKLKNVVAKGRSLFVSVSDNVLIESSKFEADDSSHLPPDIWARAKSVILRDVELYGFTRGQDKTNIPSPESDRAIYFDVSTTDLFIAENILIDGYDDAIKMVSARNGLLNNTQFKDVKVVNTSTVLSTPANYKDFIQFSNIVMENCNTYSNQYFRFRYPIVSRSGRNKICEGSTMPTIGTWVTGDIVNNIGTGEVGYWRRLTDGTSNVLGTDWKAH